MQLRNQKQQDSQNLISEISKFMKEIQKSGKSPEQLYNEVVNSGKYSKEQIDSALKKAKEYMNIF